VAFYLSTYYVDVIDIHIYAGFHLLQSHYSDILQSLPVNYEKTLDVLQNCFTSDQISLIHSSPDHTGANKMILELLVAQVKATRNLTELCNRLQKITTTLPEPSHLVSVVCKLRTGKPLSVMEKH